MLILASASVSRRQMLQNAGLDFTIETSGVDEDEVKLSLTAEKAAPRDIAETLAELKDRLPQAVNTPELRFSCPEDRKFKVVEEVKEWLKSRNDGRQVLDIDGVRVTTQDGWWLLRASNTQAALTARAESSDEAGLARLKDDLRAALASAGVELVESTSAAH